MGAGLLGLIVAAIVGAILAPLAAFTLTSAVGAGSDVEPVTKPLVNYGAKK